MSNDSIRFPAEWEKQQGILLCFPHNGNDWPGKYGAIQWAFIEIIRKITAVEQVFLMVADGSLRDKVAEMLEMAHVKVDKVSFIIQKTNRSWMRDSGPIVVKKGNNRQAIQFSFNGWAKYSNFRLDKQVPVKVADFLGIPLVTALHKGRPVVMEGGAIDSNGNGTLLTSEECLLDPKTQVRNPGFSKNDYEEVFRKYLGISNVIWLGAGIEGDDTHGHVDDLCRFVNPTTIVTVVEVNPRDQNHAALKDNLKRLRNARLENGALPAVVTLPMPQRLDFDRIRLPASYANFLIINKSVLVPVFNDPNDRIALNILSDCFPGREILPIGATDLIWGFGTLHCLSQQIPE
jgi:agmatine deiminase